MKSPAFESESNNNVFFIDQQRILLKNGEYSLELIVWDMKSDFTKTHTEIITINYDNISISDIQLIDNYSIAETEDVLTKSGYSLSPFISNFYSKSINELTYYVEVYNTKQLAEGKYVLHTYIESFETNVPLYDYNKILIIGMGGSAIGGDFARRIIQNQSSVPMFILRDYSLEYIITWFFLIFMFRIENIKQVSF